MLRKTDAYEMTDAAQKGAQKIDAYKMTGAQKKKIDAHKLTDAEAEN